MAGERGGGGVCGKFGEGITCGFSVCRCIYSTYASLGPRTTYCRGAGVWCLDSLPVPVCDKGFQLLIVNGFGTRGMKKTWCC